MTQLSLAKNDQLITHNAFDTPLDLEEHRERLRKNPNLTLPLEEELDLLSQLSQFELGRFLLKNRGLNGYYTAYALIHALKLEITHPLEKWIIHKSPILRSTQERFGIFQTQIQKYLSDGMTIASMPCGLMDDLLTLDYSGMNEFRLVGIDLDTESLKLAQKNAEDHHKISNTTFIERSAWHLDINERFDILVSNGLNIYEPDNQRVIDLYKNFHRAIKPKGLLITSFVTPPPPLSKDSSWKNFVLEDVIKQKAILTDIIQVKWQSFRTESETRAQLEHCGFKIIEMIYDDQGMFPTVVAQKE